MPSMAPRREINFGTGGTARSQRYFLREARLRPPLRGTFAPERRALERPIAMACLRFFTFLPERPLRSEPDLRFFIARLTFFAAFLPYFLAIAFSRDRFQRAGSRERVAIRMPPGR